MPTSDHFARLRKEAEERKAKELLAQASDRIINPPEYVDTLAVSIEPAEYSAPKLPKYCINCNNLAGARRYPETWETWGCIAEQNKLGVNIVNGLTIYKHNTCQAARHAELDCAEKGFWFTPYIGNENKLSVQSKDLADVIARRNRKLTDEDLNNL